MTTRYSISFDSTREIPSDVLLEHVAYHLRSLTGEDGAKLSNYRVESHLTARAHPFDGEELFDDDVPEGYVEEWEKFLGDSGIGEEWKTKIEDPKYAHNLLEGYIGRQPHAVADASHITSGTIIADQLNAGTLKTKQIEHITSADEDETPEENLTFEEFLASIDATLVVEPEIVQQNQKPKGRAKGTFPNLLALLDAKKGKR